MNLQAQPRRTPAGSPEPLDDLYEVESYQKALSFMERASYLRSVSYQEKLWVAYRIGGDPELVEFEARFVRRFERLRIPVYCSCFVRTDAEQAALFVQGVTQLRPKESPHNFGKAVHLEHATRGRSLPDRCWELFGHVGFEIASQIGLEVDWGAKDGGRPWHWQLPSFTR